MRLENINEPRIYNVGEITKPTNTKVCNFPLANVTQSQKINKRLYGGLCSVSGKLLVGV